MDKDLKKRLNKRLRQNKELISKKYPNHCNHCSGRGGTMIDWYDDDKKFIACKHCVSKGIEPLDINLKISIPENYGLYEYEDGETYPMWWDDDENANHFSSILKLRFDDDFNWIKTEMGEIHYLNSLLEKITLLEKEVENKLKGKATWQEDEIKHQQNEH